MKKKKQEQQTVNYAGEDHDVKFTRYSNGQLAMALFKGNQAVCSVSINLTDDKADKDCIFVNNVDNPGIMDAMVEAGALMPTGRTTDSEGHNVPECEILEPWLSQAREAV